MAVETTAIQVISISDALGAVSYLLGVGAVVFTGLLTLIYQATIRRLDRIEAEAKADNERSYKLLQTRLSTIDADLRELKKEVNSLWRETSRQIETQVRKTDG